MRIQNVGVNNYSNNYATNTQNKTPGFKANVHSVVSSICDDGQLCEPALMKLETMLINLAVKAGKIKPENIGACIAKPAGEKYIDLLILDSTTKEFANFSRINPESPSAIKFFDNAIANPETEEMALSVPEESYCHKKLGEMLAGIFGQK